MSVFFIIYFIIKANSAHWRVLRRKSSHQANTVQKAKTSTTTTPACTTATITVPTDTDKFKATCVRTISSTKVSYSANSDAQSKATTSTRPSVVVCPTSNIVARRKRSLSREAATSMILIPTEAEIAASRLLLFFSLYLYRFLLSLAYFVVFVYFAATRNESTRRCQDFHHKTIDQSNFIYILFCA